MRAMLLRRDVDATSDLRCLELPSRRNYVYPHPQNLYAEAPCMRCSMEGSRNVSLVSLDAPFANV